MIGHRHRVGLLLGLLLVHCRPPLPAQISGGEARSREPRPDEGDMADPVRLAPFHVKATVDKKGARTIDVDGYDARMLFERARRELDAGRYEPSAAIYGQLVQEFPDSELAPFALYNRGLAKERLSDYQGAVSSYSALIDAYPGSRDVKDALFRIAGAYEALEAWERAVETYDTILADRPEITGIERVECLVRRGAALLSQGRLDQAEDSLRRGVGLFKTEDGLASTESPFFLGMAQFKLGEVEEARMRATALPADESVLEPALEKKCRLLLDAQTEYTNAIRLAHPHWAAAAAYRIGHLYRALFDDMMSAPTPADLNEEEREIYFQVLKRRLRVLLEKAMRQWERVLEMSDRLDLKSEWVDRTRADLDEARAVLASGEDAP